VYTVCREHRTNEDLEIDEAAGVVRYTPRTIAKFLPERSIGDPEKVFVTMPNVAMLVRVLTVYLQHCVRQWSV
jgi:hypothetical protein